MPETYEVRKKTRSERAMDVLSCIPEDCLVGVDETNYDDVKESVQDVKCAVVRAMKILDESDD